MKNIVLINNCLNMKKIRVIVILFVCCLRSFDASATETLTERNIINSIKKFNTLGMPSSFSKLWAMGVDNNTRYNVWQSIKSSGDRHYVNWSGISFYDSYQETIFRNGKKYKCGVMMLKLKVNQGDYSALGIFYLTDINGQIINMRDNWSRELGDVPVKAKESLKRLVDRWL